MPTASQSHAQTSARPKVTDTIARHVAYAFDVCRAGSLVAMHCHTAHGGVIIHFDEAEFELKARGRRDSNGNPWRGLRPVNGDALVKADAAATVPKESCAHSIAIQHEIESGGPCASAHTTPGLAAQIWEWHKQNLDATVAAAAARFRAQPDSYGSWLTHYQRGELRRLRREAGLSLCPRQVATNHTQLAAAGQPLPKPGGKL